MKKIMILTISLFLFLALAGCPDTVPTDTNTTINSTINITDDVTTSLIYFYDPSLPIKEQYDGSIELIKSKFPDLIIEERCIDLQNVMSGTESASTQQCIEMENAQYYNDSLELFIELQPQSLFIIKDEGEYTAVPHSFLSSKMYSNVCELLNDLEGCDDLLEVPTVTFKLLGVESDQNAESIQMYTAFFSSQGIYSGLEVIEYNSTEGQALVEDLGLTYVPSLLIEKNQNGEADSLFDALVSEGSIKENNVYYYTAATEGTYVGPVYNDSTLEVFIMTYCPYGLQEQKAVIPVMKLFEDVEEINVEIKYVDYIMHPTTGETEENTRQYCIDMEQSDKYLDYITCFVEAGDTEGCINKTNVNQSALDDCYSRMDELYNITALHEDKTSWVNGRYPQYNVHKAENDLYGVGGSPTLVFNGQIVQWARVPETIKDNLCAQLANPPLECETELSTSAPGAMWGAVDDTSGTAAEGSCG